MNDRTVIAAGAAALVLAPVVAGVLAGLKVSNATLAIAAGAVAAAGVTRGVRHLRRERKDLEWRLRGLNIIMRSQVPSEEQEELRRQTLLCTSTWNDVNYLHQVTRLAVLDQAADNTASIVLALLGLAAGTAASVWSVWI
ncbi:hypothetical protein ADK55_19170 [Streptomyces sp. WM4235]|uniref:hypothetical protein n=1 Tax=Streptomyces sp. WM4235 TaxID=1415551 RepID=UPI0006AF6B73|nr:hypothetical protein [Streptomyces sp. WM4235]KOU48990.1 hypothetical protein ADK55_19170 [Streptomyces sp. WM4235]